MDLKTAIESRISVREFTDQEVDTEDLKTIIRLAGFAPSINNYQPWKFYAITDKRMLKEMVEYVMKEIALLPESASRMAKTIKKQAAWYSTFFLNAPMLLALAGKAHESDIEKGVVLSHDELERIKNYPDLQSAGACIQNLLLAATDLGYGTCWMTGPLYARQAIEGLLSIQEPWRLIAFVAIGHPLKSEKSVRIKRDISEEIIFIG